MIISHLVCEHHCLDDNSDFLIVNEAICSNTGKIAETESFELNYPYQHLKIWQLDDSYRSFGNDEGTYDLETKKMFSAELAILIAPVQILDDYFNYSREGALLKRVKSDNQKMVLDNLDTKNVTDIDD